MIHEGHPGIVRMKMFARNYVWWPKLDQDLESKVQRAEIGHTDKSMSVTQSM